MWISSPNAQNPKSVWAMIEQLARFFPSFTEVLSKMPQRGSYPATASDATKELAGRALEALANEPNPLALIISSAWPRGDGIAER